MVLMQVKTAGYQPQLQNYIVYAPSVDSSVSSVPLDLTVYALCLYTSVHSEQGAVNRVQI